MKRLRKSLNLIVAFAFIFCALFSPGSMATAEPGDPPQLTSTDLPISTIVGVIEQLQISVANPADGSSYNPVRFNYRIENIEVSDIARFEYWNESQSRWDQMPMAQSGADVIGYYGPITGFPIPAGYSNETEFRVAFDTAGNYTVVIDLVDMSTEPDTVLASMPSTIDVYAAPSLTTDLNELWQGELIEYHVTADNPLDGGKILTGIYFEYRLTDINLGDIAILDYWDAEDEQWKHLPKAQDGADVTGYFGPSGGFTMNPGYHAETLFRVQINSTGEHDLTLKLVDVAHARDLVTTTSELPVYARPTMSSTDLPFEAMAGEPKQFSITTENPAEGKTFAAAFFTYRVDNVLVEDIEVFDYLAGSDWKAMPKEQSGDDVIGYFGPSTGFMLPAPYSATTQFRVQFKNGGVHPIHLQLIDLAVDPDVPAASLDDQATFYDWPTITSADLPTRFWVDDLTEFHVTTDNPATGTTYPQAKFLYTLTDAQVDDVALFQYLHGEDWLNMPKTQSGDDVIGYFGPAAGFEVAPGYHAETTFRVHFAQSGGPHQLSVRMVDLSQDPDAPLTTYSQELGVYNRPTLTSTDLPLETMAGALKEFTVTTTNPEDGFPYGHALFRYQVTGISTEDIVQFEYNDAGTWTPMPMTQQGSNVVGYFGPISGFPLIAPYDVTTSFRIRTSKSGVYPVNIMLVDLDTVPEEEVASLNSQQTVFDWPTITSDDLPTVLWEEEEGVFHITANNPETGKPFGQVLFEYQLSNTDPSDIAFFQYYSADEEQWFDMPVNDTGDGVAGYFGPLPHFAMPAPYSATTQFRIGFNTSGQRDFALQLVDLSLEPKVKLAELTGSLSTFSRPSINSSDMPLALMAGELQTFEVTTTNPAAGGKLIPLALFTYRIEDISAGDIEVFNYWDGAEWKAMPVVQDGADVVGYFGPSTGFPMPAGHNATTLFQVQLKTSGSHNFNLNLVDLAEDPDETVSTFTSSATVYDWPVISPDDLPDSMWTHESTEFHITTENPPTGKAHGNVLFKYRLTNTQNDDITTFQYYSVADSEWLDMPVDEDGSDVVGFYGPETGFSMPVPYAATTLFRIEFETAGLREFTLQLVDLSAEPDSVLAEYEGSLPIYDRPTFSSSDLPLKVMAGELKQFSITTTNSDTGKDFAEAFFTYRIEGIQVEDIEVFAYLEGAEWKDMPKEQAGSDVIGYFGPTDGFPMPSPYNATTQFRVQFKTSGSYNFTLNQVELAEDPDEVVGTLTSSVTVYDWPTITSDDLPTLLLAGEQDLFSITTEIPATGQAYENVQFRYRLSNTQAADIIRFDYYSFEVEGWLPMPVENDGGDVVGYFGPLAGFSMPAPYSATTLFRIEFASDAERAFVVTLVNQADGDAELARLEGLISPYERPMLSSGDLPLTVMADESEEVHIRAINPTDGKAFDQVLVRYRIHDMLVADVADLSYWTGSEWAALPYEQDGDDVVGYFGPSSGFSMNVGYDETTRLRVEFTEPGTYEVEIQLVDLSITPEFLLAQLSSSVTVGSAAVIPAAPVTEQNSHPDETVQYTFTLTNHGNLTDTFTLQTSGNQWETLLSETTVTLAPGASREITVTVQVPSGEDGEQDCVKIIATSTNNPDVSEEISLTTTCAWYKMILPLIWN